MKASQSAPSSIDDYIKGFSADVQQILEQICHAIRQAAPDAEEVISYQMPAFKQHGIEKSTLPRATVASCIYNLP